MNQIDSRNSHLIEPLEARIAPSQAAFLALNGQLHAFALDKNTADPTLLTAKADDVVYAVFQLTKTASFDQRDEVADLVVTALEALNGKVRADKDKLAPRILNAALSGSGITDGGDIALIVDSLTRVNHLALAKLQLTVAGKEAVIGQALKITNGGSALGALAYDLSSAVAGSGTRDAKLQTFVIAAVKAAGTATGQISGFIDRVLNNVTGDRDVFALRVAEGVVTIPNASGEVIGGRAVDDDTQPEIITTTQLAMKDTKLVKAIAAVVHATAGQLVATTPEQFTTALIGANGLGTKATAVNRGAVASGVIANLDAMEVMNGKVASVIDTALNGRPPLTKAELSTFAGAASQNTGNYAGDVVAKVVNIAGTVAPMDITVRKNIGIAALKAIAPTTPEAGSTIAQKLIDASDALFAGEAAKTDLAKALAKGVPTSLSTAGFAVAGVALKMAMQDAATYATLGKAVIPLATKATFNIAKELSALLPADSDYKSFAALIATGVSTAVAPNVAAGVAVTATTSASTSFPQTAGEVAAAVARASTALKSKAATIAGAVALAVDVEQIADIGAKVGALYQRSIPADVNLPKFSAIGTLATSLAKAINTKPLTGTANRVDELGELAAELTRQAIARLGPTDPKLASTIAAIGSAAMKGLSVALLINGGGFAADLNDAARDIAGAIAQTISIGAREGTLTNDGQADALIIAGGSLELALKKAAAKFASEVTTAFSDVRGATGATNRLYIDPVATKNEPVSNANTGGSISGNARYEIGSVHDSQTPIATL
ncbi:MAG: hypothetical protein QOE70_755 [Chthoniobacter sp.]|jgi:hypothetical protein|nr:hypothetical protein [Chthoniobacter sp.]